MYYKYNNYNLYYEKYGTKGKKIIILPGWGNTRKTFISMIETLKKNNIIYIIDYPGFGNSNIINKELTLDDYTLMIYSFIKELNINKPTIISHSFGGRITSKLISKYSLPVNKLILIDVAGIKRIKPLIIFKKYIYKLLQLLTFFLPKTKKYYIRKKIFNKFSSSDYKTIPINMRKTFKNIINENLLKCYKKIDVETLIIWGTKDKDTPLKDAYLLNRIIKKSKLLLFKNSGHFSYLDHDKETNEIIKRFIKIDE